MPFHRLLGWCFLGLLSPLACRSGADGELHARRMHAEFHLCSPLRFVDFFAGLNRFAISSGARVEFELLASLFDVCQARAGYSTLGVEVIAFGLFGRDVPGCWPSR